MKVYRAGWSRYQAFAEQFDIAPTPITSEKATLFIAHVGAQGLAVSTIEAYLAGLRHYRIRGDPSDMNPSLHTPFINLMLRGIKRVNAAKKPTQVRLPITVTIMEKIKHSLASEPLCVENRMVWAACCTGFFGFLRCAEFLTPDDAIFDPADHLGITDISYMHAETQPYIMINVKASKTDQFRKGTSVSLGATGAELCPVAAILDYLQARGGAPGPLFINTDGSPLRRKQFVLRVQAALTQAGVKGEHFNGHSFRIGAATSASQAGVAESTIKVLGRWQSMAYQGYIRPATPALAGISKKMVQKAVHE